MNHVLPYLFAKVEFLNLIISALTILFLPFSCMHFLVWSLSSSFFFSLSSPKNYSLVILAVGISTSILILLISNFLS